MLNQLNRYYNETIIDHLASQYVLGLLTINVHARVNKLIKTNHLLAKQIIYWQNNFSYLDQQTSELAPKIQTWQHIENKLQQIEHNETSASLKKSFWSWPHFRQFIYIVASATIALLTYQVIKPAQLSYLAVLTDTHQQTQFVVNINDNSKLLMINVINKLKITQDQDLEIWVVSKTDQQISSLGIIPRNTPLIQKQLSNAQWRLIKDSDSLIITIESLGGSSIDKPSDLITAHGLSLRLH